MSGRLSPGQARDRAERVGGVLIISKIKCRITLLPSAFRALTLLVKGTEVSDQ